MKSGLEGRGGQADLPMAVRFAADSRFPQLVQSFIALPKVIGAKGARGAEGASEHPSRQLGLVDSAGTDRFLAGAGVPEVPEAVVAQAGVSAGAVEKLDRQRNPRTPGEIQALRVILALQVPAALHGDMRAQTLLAFAAAVLTLTLSGCGGGPGGVTPAQDAEGRYVVSMTSQLTFDPVEAKVPAGSTVLWVNDASVPHDVAGYKGDPIKDDRTQFSSTRMPPEGLGRLMQPGESWAHTFNETGTWTIWCHTHHEQDMKMVLHVT